MSTYILNDQVWPRVSATISPTCVSLRFGLGKTWVCSSLTRVTTPLHLYFLNEWLPEVFCSRIYEPLASPSSAEPMKKKKKADIDPQKLKKQKRKLEKAIKKLESKGRKLKPLLEIEGDRAILKTKESVNQAYRLFCAVSIRHSFQFLFPAQGFVQQKL